MRASREWKRRAGSRRARRVLTRASSGTFRGMNLARVLGTVGLVSLALAPFARRRREPLTGRVVCITGGSRGLGLQIAREAARRGGRLALLARSARELDAARDEIARSGAEVRTFVCDVRDRDDVRRTIDDVVAACGAIDVLVTVAGVISVGPFEAFDFEHFANAMDANFYGTLNAMTAVLPAMRARRSGRIVNITSLGAKISIPHMLPYCASKFAVYALSVGLGAEVARDGVAVTTVVPGLMRTGSPPRATFVGRPQAEYVTFAASDALPFTSVDVAHAARVILDGCERRSARVIVSWQAHVALIARRVVPGVVDALLVSAARLLPDAGKRERRTGFASESAFTRSWVFGLSRRAMETQHEFVDRTDRDP